MRMWLWNQNFVYILLPHDKTCKQLLGPVCEQLDRCECYTWNIYMCIWRHTKIVFLLNATYLMRMSVRFISGENILAPISLVGRTILCSDSSPSSDQRFSPQPSFLAVKWNICFYKYQRISVHLTHKICTVGQSLVYGVRKAYPDFSLWWSQAINKPQTLPHAELLWSYSNIWFKFYICLFWFQ